MNKIAVVLSDCRTKLLAYGGVPGGRDHVHAAVCKWPGWRRLRTSGQMPELDGGLAAGTPCSVFAAPLSLVTAASVASYTGGVCYSRESAEAINRAMHSAQLIRSRINNDNPKVNYAFLERIPMKHQLQALMAGLTMGPNILLADDMGLGKTSTAVWHMDIHLADERVLVVCPASVKYNWRREIWNCLGRETFVQVIDGTPKDRASQIRDLEAFRRSGGQGYAIINYDLLTRMADLKKNQLVVSDNLMILRDWTQGGGLICDESYYLKNRKSLRYRVVHDMFAPANGGAVARIMASGTPVRNLVDDLYAQVELIRPGTWTSYTDFKTRYLEVEPRVVGRNEKTKKLRRAWVPVAGKNLDELNSVMQTIQIRRKKEDVLGLPPKIRTKPELELEGKHLGVYKSMKDLALYDLGQLDEEESIFSTQSSSALQSALRCEQIAQGFVGGIPDGFDIPWKLCHKVKGRPSELVFPDSPKMAWMVETIEMLWQQGCRPVVFSKFNAPLFWLRHKFGDDAFIMHGGHSSKTKATIIDKFQAGERKLILCQVKIAEGFDLTTSQDELFLSRDWSPAVNSQAEDRCHRIGQRGTVNIQIPIVMNTIEKMIDARLEAKAADADAALRVKDLMEAL